MKKTSLTFALALAMFSQGCVVVEDPSPGPSPGPAPSPPPPPTQPAPPPPDGLLRIDNDSSFDLFEIYVTPIDASTWGPDLLGGDILFPGESLSVEVGCDYYDAMVVDEFGNQCEILSLDLCGDSAVWSITNDALAACGGFGNDSTITVQNSSNYVLEDIYITPVNVFDWGPDRLGSDALFPGESVTIELTCDVYDVLVVDELGAECMLLDLDLCFDSAIWLITNSVLESCAFGATSESLTKQPRALPEKHQQAPVSRTSDRMSLPAGEVL